MFSSAQYVQEKVLREKNTLPKTLQFKRKRFYKGGMETLGTTGGGR